jgi:hypothetical protein
MLPAQDIYTDMLAEGKTWSLIRWPYGKTHRMGMRGDSIVGGMTCKKYGYVNDDGSFSCTAVFRQEGDKVYVKYPNRQDFSLAYDFGTSVGDTLDMELSLFEWARIVVTSKDVVNARGHEMRQVSYKVAEYHDGIEWRPVEGNYGSSWIEGIGGSTGPVSNIPVPGLTGNYDYMTDIGLGGELLCDAYIFSGQDSEKMMLTFKPEWTYTKQLWDEVKGGWGEPVEGHAMKTGMELPPPMNFPYTAISIEEEEDGRLLLRNGDPGQVLAEKASYLEYMSKAFPGMDDVFTELAYYPLDVVLYDFSLNVGDRYPCRGDVTVEEISQMTTRDGISRKLFRLSNGLEILEGLGCLNSRYGVFAYQNDPGTGSQGKERVASLRGDAASGMGIQSFRKYGSDSDPVFIIGDVELGITLSKTERVAGGTIHDLQGRRLNGTPQKGIYIRNGRKYVR